MRWFQSTAPIVQCPSWRCVLSAAVGGLTEIGFSADETRLLVVSHDGRGLFDLASGQRLARDDEAPVIGSEWIDHDSARVRGIGAAVDEWFDMIGLRGGTLASSTAAGWHAQTVGRGRREQALLGRQGERRRWLVAQPATEIRAFGFSKSGRWLVLATSADLTVFASN